MGQLTISMAIFNSYVDITRPGTSSCHLVLSHWVWEDDRQQDLNPCWARPGSPTLIWLADTIYGNPSDSWSPYNTIINYNTVYNTYPNTGYCLLLVRLKIGRLKITLFTIRFQIKIEFVWCPSLVCTHQNRLHEFHSRSNLHVLLIDMNYWMYSIVQP